MDLGRFGDAVASCDAALGIGPPSAEFYEIRGLARGGRDDFVGAIEDVTQALALADPADRPGLLTMRGNLYLLSDAPKLALPDFDAALALDPARAEAYSGRGSARARLGRLPRRDGRRRAVGRAFRPVFPPRAVPGGPCLRRNRRCTSPRRRARSAAGRGPGPPLPGPRRVAGPGMPCAGARHPSRRFLA